jgi:hypothetical protein
LEKGDMKEIRTAFFEHYLNGVDPPVFEIPQDCSTGRTHEGSSKALETGDGGCGSQDNVRDRTHSIDEMHILSAVRAARVVGYLSPSQISESFTMVAQRIAEN